MIYCPVCTAELRELVLHPQTINCWWCDYEINYQKLVLEPPFNFDFNHRPCAACGLMLSIGNCDQGYCVECIKPDYEIDDDNDPYLYYV